jgi:hypothetical protein
MERLRVDILFIFSSEMRPAYITQYSPEIIKKKDSNECWGLKDPFIIDGKRRAII